MSHAVDPHTTRSWTAADLVQRFGPIPLHRVCPTPPPGTATEADVVRLHDHADRLFELVDCTLVEKTVGTYESYLAVVIARYLANFAADRQLGIVLGADGMLRLAPGLVRIPDVSFISWSRLPSRHIPDQAIADVVPELVVEVVSAGNTREELDRKRREYLSAGVQIVWYVDPKTRAVSIDSQATPPTTVSADQSLDGGQVLPGFSLPLKELW